MKKKMLKVPYECADIKLILFEAYDIVTASWADGESPSEGDTSDRWSDP